MNLFLDWQHTCLITVETLSNMAKVVYFSVWQFLKQIHFYMETIKQNIFCFD